MTKPENDGQLHHSIQLRLEADTDSPGDLTLSIQEKTFEYLRTSDAKEIKISAYLDRDWPEVVKNYSEVFVEDGCAFKVREITPGSRTRKVSLPGPMNTGEQITIRVTR